MRSSMATMLVTQRSMISRGLYVIAQHGWRWWGVPLAHFGAGLVGLDEHQEGLRQ